MSLSGGAGYDLVVTGSANISSVLDVSTVGRFGNLSGYQTTANQYALQSNDAVTGDQMGMSIDNAAYGNTGWSGPGIWVDDNVGNYPVLIGFQNKATWTDGTISMLKHTNFVDGLTITGSVAQEPHAISISSQTGSVDFSQSNIQTLTLASGVATHIEATNMTAGQSVVIEITQDASSAGTVTFDGSITFPGGTDYVPTTTLGGKDVLTLISFDGTVARGQGQNDFS